MSAVEVIVAIAFGLAGIIVSIGAIIFTMKQQYIHIRGKFRQEYFSHCTNFMVVDTRYRKTISAARKRTSSCRGHQAPRDSALVTGRTACTILSPNARNSIELEDQSSRVKKMRTCYRQRH